MTTYIPSLTLPSFVFDNAAASILLPVIAGAGIGYSITRKSSTLRTVNMGHYIGTKSQPVLCCWQCVVWIEAGEDAHGCGLTELVE